jgi:AcrR family transcriptional regulator
MSAAVELAAAPRPRRADAVRNRERVLRAAAEVFAEKGLEAGVPEVAARAGVGKATVYRSFPSKDHLVAAVRIDRLRWFERTALQGAAAPDAWGAFSRFLLTIAEAHATDRMLTDSLAVDIDLPELDDARAATSRAIAALMLRAKQQGAMRADATPADLRVLFGGTARILAAEERRDVRTWRRYARLVAAALKA